MKKFIVLFAGLMIFSLAAFAQSPDPVISFEKKVHDFGTIKLGEKVSYAFKFTNTGKAPLILSQPRSSCGCTVPSWPKEPIMPGRSGEILITFDAEEIATFAKQITVISNAENSPEIILIKGVVVN